MSNYTCLYPECRSLFFPTSEDFVAHMDNRHGLSKTPGRYELLKSVLTDAAFQAEEGKGKERHADPFERFQDQQIVKIGTWLGSNHFQIGQAVKKAIESTRLDPDAAEAELLGAINYLAAAVIVLRRKKA